MRIRGRILGRKEGLSMGLKAWQWHGNGMNWCK